GLTVDLTVADATGSDFVASEDEDEKTVTIAAGKTSAAYSVATQADSTDEPNGDVTVTVKAGTGYKVGTAGSAAVTVHDDDASAPAAPCAATTSSFWDESNIALTSTTDSIAVNVTTNDVTVTYRLCKAGSSAIHATGGPTSSKTHTFSSLDAGTQYWVRVESAAQGASQWVAIRTGGGTPAAPTVTIAAVASPVTEGTAARFRVTSSAAAPTGGLTVDLTVADATGSDFVALGDEGSKTVTIAAGHTFAVYSVATQADRVGEPHGTVTATVGLSTAYTVGIAGSAAVTVRDDDGPPIFVSATTNTVGSEVAITFSEPITRLPVHAVWTVTAGGAVKDVISSRISDRSDSPVVTLALAPGKRIAAGQTVKLRYTRLAGAALAGAGGPVADFSDRNVTNAVERPTIVSVAIVSDPGPDKTYARGDRIRVGVTFSEAVTVTGTPTIGVKMGANGGTKPAAYERGSGTTMLTFAYTVVSPNGTPDGDGIGVPVQTSGAGYAGSGLLLKGGAIRSAGTGSDATDLTYAAVAFDPNHLVDSTQAADTTAPTFVSAVVDGRTLTVTFSETLDPTWRPAGEQFVVTDGDGDGDHEIGEGTASVAGAVVTVRLENRFLPTQTNLKLAYTKPGSNPLRDAAENDVESFSNKAVTNNTAPGPTGATVSGKTLTITFDLDLDTSAAAKPAPNRFRYTRGGSPEEHNPTAVTVSGKTVKLTLRHTVTRGEELSVRYIAPASGGLRGAGTSGHPVRSFAIDRVRNDTTKRLPRLSSAIAHFVRHLGDTPTILEVKLTFDALLRTDSPTLNDVEEAIEVKVDGATRTLFDAPAPALPAFLEGNNTYFIYLTGSLAHGQVVTVTYRGGYLHRLAENIPLGHFTDYPVENKVPPDLTAPEFKSATTSPDGKKIFVTFSEPILGGQANFKVSVDGGAGVAPEFIHAVTGEPAKFRLTLKTAVKDGQDVKLSYTKPSSTSRFRDVAGNALESFENKPVFEALPDTAASIVSAVITSVPRSDDTYRKVEKIDVAVTWDKDVTWDLSAANAKLGVRLQIGTDAKRADLVTGGATSGTARVLRFRYRVVSTDSDTTDGIQLGRDNNSNLVLLKSGATLQAANGQSAATNNAALTFAADAKHKVDGSLAADTAAPTLSSAAGDGATLTLTYNERL
ncbi:MAG: hypothetical protein F4Y04_04680, partial [Chloroflexi bacterium]|nr:hypothetical protein [Chloroflexota bacterium]